MVAVPESHRSRVLGYSQEFSNEIKETGSLRQKVTIFSPVSDLTIANKSEVLWNQRYSFFNANDVYKQFGMCPAYLQALLLKPLDGGGVNTEFDVFPIREENATPTNKDFIIKGDNRNNVTYNVMVNGRRYMSGRESQFVITSTDDTAKKIDKVIAAVNNNIFSPIKASKTIMPAAGKRIETVDLSTNLPAILNVVDGGMNILTNNNGSYDIKINTAGTSGKLETANLSTKLAAIYALSEASMNISEDGGSNREFVYNTALSHNASTIVSRHMAKNYGNFTNFAGNFTITQGTKTATIALNTNNHPAVLSSSIIDAPKLSAFKALSAATLKLQTNTMPQPVELNMDLTGITTLETLITELETALQSANAPISVRKNKANESIEFYSVSAGSDATLNFLTTPAGTDISTATYLGLSAAGKYHGVAAINTTSTKSVVDWLVAFINRQLSIDKNEDFITVPTYDSQNIAFKSITSSTTDQILPLQITNINGLFLDSDHFDINTAVHYTRVAAIDSELKLNEYFILQCAMIEIGGVDYNSPAHVFTFRSSSIGATSSISITPGATGTDLTTANLLNIAAATKTLGTAKMTTLQQVATEIRSKLTAVNAPVAVQAIGNILIFENTGHVGESSILHINLLGNHTGEQLSTAALFDIDRAREIPGNDEVDAVRFTTKWSGVSSTDLQVEIVPIQRLDNNLTFIESTSQTGSGVLSLQEAFDNVGDVWTTILINTYGTQYFDLFSNFIGRPEDKNGRYEYDKFKPAIAFTGTTESDYDMLILYGKNRVRDLANTLCTAPNAKVFGFEVAAAYAELCSRIYEESPHSTISGRFLNNIPVPDHIGKMNDSEWRELFVTNGISTVSLNSSEGMYKVEDHITFRRPDDQPATAIDYRDVRNMLGIDFNIAYQTRALELIHLLDKTIVGENVVTSVGNTIKASHVRGIFESAMLSWESKALIYDADSSIKTLTVKLSPINPQRFDINFNFTRSSTLNIVSTTARAAFKFGI